MLIHEPTSDITIYTQISKQLIELMVRGQFIGGEALPSVRSVRGFWSSPPNSLICISVK